MTLQSRLCALSSNARVLLTPLSARVWAYNGCSTIRIADKPQGHGRSPNISSLNGIRAFCTDQGQVRTARCQSFHPIIGQFPDARINPEDAFECNDLSIKKCVPCSSKDLKPMTEDAANILIQQVPGWDLVKEDGTQKLHRSWKVKTFVKGMEFLQLVADVAEAEGHHPDLHLVGWNNVKIDIWTHAVGGLTENDFILAAKINGLNLHHLLRITPANK